MQISYGTINADSDSIHYDQTNNIFERFLKDLKDSGQTKFYLETCNMNAAGCAVEAVGGKWKYTLPLDPKGKSLFGQDDLMAFYLYSTYGQSNAPSVKDGVCENEVKSNIAWVIGECALVRAELVVALNAESMVQKMDDALLLGKAIVLSYFTDYNSGHFITLVKRDSVLHTFTAHDPWPSNNLCRNGGVREVYPDSFFITRCTGDRLKFVTVCRKEA